MQKMKLRRWSWYQKRDQVTCTPTNSDHKRNQSHAHPQVLLHMLIHLLLITCFPSFNSGQMPPPKNLQVNRSSKSRAKRSDSERQRLMSRCQSLKESGAQAIAEKVGLSNRGQKLKNLWTFYLIWRRNKLIASLNFTKAFDGTISFAKIIRRNHLIEPFEIQGKLEVELSAARDEIAQMRQVWAWSGG